MSGLVVVYGPSGTGKSSLIKTLIRTEDKFSLNVSHTTRSPRPNEENGIHYRFIDEGKFEEMKSCGEFLETFEYVGRKYGTSFESIENCLRQGKIPALDVNVKTVKKIRGNEFIIKNRPIYIFIKPPSLDELRRRLVNRGESEENVSERMKHAEKEIQEGDQYADLILDNVDLETTYIQFKNNII